MYIPKVPTNSLSLLPNLYGKPPYHFEKWVIGFPYIPPSTVVTLAKSIKDITAEEAAKRVRL